MATDTTAPSHLPAPKEVRDLLGDLLDKEVALRPGPPFGVSPFYPASIASYVDDSLVVRAVVAMDLPLSAYAGAALALVPKTGADAAIEQGLIDGSLAESLREVFNIVASLFNGPSSAHLRLYSAATSGEPLSADLRARTQILGRRDDLVVDVAGYGTGRLAIVLC
ncbi:hypothetical protein [Nocardioides sp. R-C-SC26]|uniref:hypothetical protein n=1 Tax=Nocardioides sp. R-C-SC26 TaxID=2870414 RepID=UPI001E5AD711|nr:hypothetical protein [Nocardioides sp. R-C-SC26]